MVKKIPKVISFGVTPQLYVAIRHEAETKETTISGLLRDILLKMFQNPSKLPYTVYITEEEAKLLQRRGYLLELDQS